MKAIELKNKTTSKKYRNIYDRFASNNSILDFLRRHSKVSYKIVKAIHNPNQ